MPRYQSTCVPPTQSKGAEKPKIGDLEEFLSKRDYLGAIALLQVRLPSCCRLMRAPYAADSVAHDVNITASL